MSEVSPTSRPCCSVGARPDAPAVDEALRAGGPENSIRKVAARFDLPPAAIQRHREHLQEGRSTAGQSVAEEPRPAAADTVVDAVVIQAPFSSPRQSRARIQNKPDTRIDTVDDTAPLGPIQDDVLDRFAEVPEGRIARVAAIEDMMLDLAWEKGKTGPLLAQAWGLTLSAIESYSAEASRNVKRNVDPAAVKERLGTALSRGVNLALTEGDVKALASCAKTYAEIAGLVLGGGTTINFYGSPDWQRIRDVILQALMPYPEALASVIAAMERAMRPGGGDGGEPALAA